MQFSKHATLKPRFMCINVNFYKTVLLPTDKQQYFFQLLQGLILI